MIGGGAGVGDSALIIVRELAKVPSPLHTILEIGLVTALAGRRRGGALVRLHRIHEKCIGSAREIQSGIGRSERI